MPTLLELQRAMRAALLAEGGIDASLDVIGGALPAAARVSVYRNNVLSNLTNALRLAFPAVARLVGEDFFSGAAAAFIRATPPVSADLYEYGEAFPDFLESFVPARGLGYLPDVARLEWAVNVALHAPPTPALTGEVLRTIPETMQPGIRFVPHPSLTLLALHHPARAIWAAVLRDDDGRAAALRAVDPAAPGEKLAVLLRDGELRMMRLSPSGYDLARALIGGEVLADALALIDAAAAAPLLGGFFADGFFARCELSRIADGQTGALQ